MQIGRIKEFIKEKKIISILAFSFVALIILNIINPAGLFPQVGKSRELYKQAKEYQDNNDPKSAYYTYSKISSGYPAYDIVLFQQAKCAVDLEDEKTVIRKLKKLLSRYPDSPIAAQAYYNLGQAFIRISDYNAAEKRFQNIIKNYPKTDFALGSYYYLGEIYSDKNKEIAAKYWFEYIRLVPDGRFTLDSVNNLLSLKNNFNANEKKAIAIALFKAQRYNESLKYLNQISLKDSWYYLAKANLNLGKRNSAFYLVKEGLNKYSNNFQPEQIYDAMRLYVKLSPQPALQCWSDLINTVKNGREYALYKKAQLIPAVYANSMYKSIVDYYPKSKYAQEAIWELFWAEFSNGNYNQAINLVDKHPDLLVNSKNSPKLLFWTGKALEKVGKRNLAKNCYKKVLELYPDSYYAFRADGRLKESILTEDPGWIANKSITIPEQDNSYPYSYSQTVKQFGIELAELMTIGDYETALTLSNDDPFIKSWLTLKDGMVSKSIVLARDGMAKLQPKPGPDDKRWRLIYPVFFAKDINYFAGINNLDSALILSLIKEESHFNPIAVSSSNALGLMQLLPGTAKDIARWKDMSTPNRFQLLDPRTNIKFGTAYFKYTRDRLSNSSLFAVAGYNGGPGAVERWLQTIPHSDMDQFVENIPYDQTRDYVKKVYSSYWNYKRIYGL